MIVLTRKALEQCLAHSQESLGVGCCYCHYYHQHYFHHYYHLSVVLNYVPVLSLKPVVTSLRSLSVSSPAYMCFDPGEARFLLLLYMSLLLPT